MMETGRNIIFLDMDGVVNSESFYREWAKANSDGDRTFFETYCMSGGVEGYVVPDLIRRFNDLCEATDSLVVWSSSWRAGFEIDGGEFDDDGIRELWKAKGLPFERYIGCTPVMDLHRMSYVPRFLEIRKWLDCNSGFPMARAAVLDDDYDAWRNTGEYADVVHFQTTWEDGLTMEIADAAKRWLNFGICE